MTREKIYLKDMIRTGQTEVSLQESYQYEDLPTVAPVTVEAHVLLNSTGGTVRGKFEAELEEPCDRCYEPYRRGIHESFDDRFVYESFIDAYPTGDMELRSEDYYDTVGEDGILDVKDLVYQHIVIAMSADRVCEQETCVIKG
jgi:uncharacterized metal-binding protein YceD (DUF177 family)